jgi:hypothetical protein
MQQLLHPDAIDKGFGVNPRNYGVRWSRIKSTDSMSGKLWQWSANCAIRPVQGRYVGRRVGSHSKFSYAGISS